MPSASCPVGEGDDVHTAGFWERGLHLRFCKTCTASVRVAGPSAAHWGLEEAELWTRRQWADPKA